MTSPSPEIDPWDRADMGVVEVATVLDFIHSLRALVDAEERRLCESCGPFESVEYVTLEEYRLIFPDGP